MKPIAPEIVSEVIDILATNGLSEEVIVQRVAELTDDEMEGRRLIDWIPEAFGVVLVAHLNCKDVPETFRAKDAWGQWHQFPLNAEPVFVEALAKAMAMYHEGPREVFQKVSCHSSIFHSVNNALFAGINPDRLTLSGPALIGIPAEVYAVAKKNPFWKRWFSR